MDEVNDVIVTITITVALVSWGVKLYRSSKGFNTRPPPIPDIALIKPVRNTIKHILKLLGATRIAVVTNIQIWNAYKDQYVLLEGKKVEGERKSIKTRLIVNSMRQ